MNLLEGCLKNNRRSQKNLYQQFYGYGLSICLRYAEDRDEAVELLNEAFMKVFKGLDSFDLNLPFKPWLRKIIVNTCINNFKKKNIEITGELTDVANQSSNDDVLSNISYKEIMEMIMQLSPAYRTVFNLYVIEGYKHEEIAEMLDISVGTSKSNLAKAKRNLRSILKDYFQVDYERTK